jgi:hypothetical protein
MASNLDGGPLLPGRRVVILSRVPIPKGLHNQGMIGAWLSTRVGVVIAGERVTLRALRPEAIEDEWRAVVHRAAAIARRGRWLRTIAPGISPGAGWGSADGTLRSLVYDGADEL